MREVWGCGSGPGAAAGSGWGCGSEVLRCGELEKRSASLFQVWKKKRVVLSRESLSLFPPSEERQKGKALGLGSIAKVDCVERTGRYLYFTLVTTDRREIDFRCPGGTGWNASIALALIDFQNQRALRRFRARRRHRAPREEEEEEGEEEGEGEVEERSPQGERPSKESGPRRRRPPGEQGRETRPRDQTTSG